MESALGRGKKVPTRNYATRVNSDKVRAYAEAKRKTASLVVKGISDGKLITVEPRMFAKLDIDPAYQRGETSEIKEIVRVLQAGGKVLDPVTLCRRPWSEDPARLWIVDGHQRVCTFQQLGHTFHAMIHESDSLEAEKPFFTALNMKKGLSANILVKSWVGLGANLILKANVKEGHPLYKRVNLTQSSRRDLIAASTLIRGMASVVGAPPTGNIHVVLGRVEFELKHNGSEVMAFAEFFLRLVGMIYTTGSVPTLVSTSIGRLAYERRSKNEVELPSARAIEKLRAINWDKEVPALVAKYEPQVAAALRRVWKV